MSLEGLISGSECALPNNPLAQVLKHTDGDRSVQRDRIAGPSSSRLQHLPSTSANHVSEGDISMARQFFDANVADGRSGVQPAQSPFLGFEHRMQMANGTGPQIQPHSTAQPQFQSSLDLHDAWMRSTITPELGKVLSMQPGAVEKVNTPPTGMQHDVQVMQNPFSSSQFYRPMGMGTGMYNTGFPQSFTPIQDQGKGKGKARDDAFEAAFAQFATELSSHSSSAKIEEVLDDSSQLENKATTDGKQSEVEDLINRFEEKMRSTDGAPKDSDAAAWEAELHSFLQNQREDTAPDYGAELREAWENGMGQYDGDTLPEYMKFDEEGVPILDPYVFDAENKYLTTPEGPSCLVQAKSLLENNGSLTEAALLLEAAIQKGDLGEGGYEAWILLGETRCMDEREEAGMRALTEGSRRAEQAGAKEVGLISLATAFTNEGYERGCHTMLLRWLSARYPEHAPSAEDAATWLRQSHWASRERVTDTFLTVARAQHAAGIVDAEVQVGLGVLFYTNGDFERAKDCFAAALAVNPRDYLLWNRYGSALSNGNKPEEALGAYREALQLRPTYTRAIYNVGVACLNIGADKEAAEHFLSALSMQESASGEKSEQLWFTLRRALLQMGREDLANRAQSGGDIASFRAEGFDF